MCVCVCVCVSVPYCLFYLIMRYLPRKCQYTVGTIFFFNFKKKLQKYFVLTCFLIFLALSLSLSLSLSLPLSLSLYIYICKFVYIYHSLFPSFYLLSTYIYI